MSAPEQSLRKHRQTLLPGATVPPKKSYGELDSYAKAQLPSVALKDKEKVGNLVKKRFSSRVQADNSLFRLGDDLPPLPPNASTMISQAQYVPTSNQAPVQAQTLHQQDLQKHTRNLSSANDNYINNITEGAQAYPPPKSVYRPTKSISSVNGVISAARPTTGEGQAYPYRTAPDQQQQQQNGHSRKKSSYSDPTTKNYASHDAADVLRTPSGEAIDTVFLDKKFDPKAYISSQLHSATDVEISAFADTLHERREQLQIDRKDELHRNYKTFLKIGSQIAGFSADVDTLRRYINDFRAVTTALVDDAENNLMNAGITSRGDSMMDMDMDGSSHGHSKANNNRSSMVMLEKMWANELSSLFKHVEGAQQYLPVTPGRHIVTESGGWYQLNAATWKPLQPIHIFLLNDNLLIATKKRNPRVHSKDGSVTSLNSLSSGSTNKRLIADICWPLSEIEMIDLSQSDAVDPSVSQYTKSSICIRAGGTKYVYRAEKPEAHTRITRAFRQAKAELSKLHRSASTSTLGDSGTGGGSSNGGGKREPSVMSKSPSARSALSAAHDEPMNDVTTTLQYMKEIDNAISNLDINIAYHRFDQAISSIESYEKELKQDNNKYHVKGVLITGDHIILSDFFKGKLDSRAAELSDLLLTELSYDYLGRQQILQYVKLLVKLGVEERAKKVFLDSRHSQLQRRIKLVEFHGDIINYIRQIAIIYFRMISTTVDIFQSCFTSVSHTSAVVEWARKEVDDYIVLFSRQLYKVEPTTTTYQKCIEITKLQDSRLAQQGLDVSFLLKVIYDAGI